MQFSILGEFKKIIYVHIGSLFIPLRLVKLIEYQLLFRFSGYFCFLEEKFRKVQIDCFYVIYYVRGVQKYKL